MGSIVLNPVFKTNELFGITGGTEKGATVRHELHAPQSLRVALPCLNLNIRKILLFKHRTIAEPDGARLPLPPRRQFA